MIRTKTKRIIDLEDWDRLVQETYGKVYSFQQQDGCKDRQMVDITIPDHPYDYENDSVPDKVNGSEMGVSFAAWLARDPKEWNGDLDDNTQWCIDLFWQRNFYPDVQMIANDLHARGLIEAGEYSIEIDW
jgi:hypothetical protein